jgi:hypothetical protein
MKRIFFGIILGSLIFIRLQATAKETGNIGVSSYPHIFLKSTNLKVTVLLPDEKTGYYRSTRFDWSGIISQVEYDSHTFFQDWENYDGTLESGIHNPLDNSTGTGTAEEFRTPLGYEEAKVGGPFVKIGVGILEKAEDKPYHWAYPYKVIEFGKWDTKIRKDGVVFVQDLNATFGYGYHYEKQVVLSENCPEIKITHTLKNTGVKAISTNSYCHNYMRFDNDYIGKNYTIEFNKGVSPVGFFDGRVVFTDKIFGLSSDLTNSSPVEGALDVHGSKRFVVTNKKTGTSVDVTSDTGFESFYLYIWRLSFCPEPMIRIILKPGESFTWNTNYKFKVNRN